MKNRRMVAATPETSPGGPVFDARLDSAYAAELSSVADRLQGDVNYHLFGGSSAAARVYSHMYDASPSPLVQNLMGLGYSAQQVKDAMERTNDRPFPGVPLGPTPGVHGAPNPSGWFQRG